MCPIYDAAHPTSTTQRQPCCHGHKFHFNFLFLFLHLLPITYSHFNHDSDNQLMSLCISQPSILALYLLLYTFPQCFAKSFQAASPLLLQQNPLAKAQHLINLTLHFLCAHTRVIESSWRKTYTHAYSCHFAIITRVLKRVLKATDKPTKVPNSAFSPMILSDSFIPSL